MISFLNTSRKGILFGLFWALLTTLTGPLYAKAYTVGFLAGSGGLGDESFNDMTYRGLGKAQQELGFTLVVRQWEQDTSMDTLFLELIDQDAQLIVLNGVQFLPLLKKFAPRYPQKFFIANDFEGGKHDNVKSIVYSQHEGAFLAGFLAASLSQTGKIGFLGAIDIDIIKAYRTGFFEGAAHSSKKAIIFEEYLSSLPDFSGFNNPEKGYKTASSMYDNGIDIIFAAAGGSGNGAILAAKDHNRFVIGVDSNQDHMAKGNVLTSVMKRLDKAVYLETTKAFKGQMIPGTTWYGLANGGISLTSMKYSKDSIPEEVREKLRNLEEQIITGKLRVSNFLTQNPAGKTSAEQQ
ncbi:MAG: BMP family ABC transporter substrate-binding protein [Desulfopila sp.]|jgi:basic membrane protein A|nr:BMP family ABC transporter substrate-binding protein [Desulfopila sp.]